MQERIRATAVLAATVCAVLSGPAGAEEEPETATLSYPHAGVSLTLPEGFELQMLAETFDVLRAVRYQEDAAVQALTLSAYPVEPSDTARAFANAKMAELKRNVNIRRLQVPKETTMPVAGVKGVARRLSYLFRGEKTVAAQVYFTRDVTKDLRICYLLSVESDEAHQGTMLRVLASAIKSLKRIDMAHPMAIELPEASLTLSDAKRGYAVDVPRGWHASSGRGGVYLFQTDLLAGGIPNPNVSVTVAGTLPETTAAACAEKLIAYVNKTATSKGLNAKVLSNEPAKLAGREGRQFVMRLSKSSDGNGEGAEVHVYRILCTPDPGGEGARSISLALVAQNAEPDAAAAKLDALAEGFSLLSDARTRPSTQPTRPAVGPTRPATNPTTSTATPD